MYVDGVVFFSESVPLFRMEEFSTYNVNSTCCTIAVEVSTRTYFILTIFISICP